MQTFLPYPDFAASAAVLDDRRLGKQRVETFQILRALTWPSYGWKNHPAVRMWRGFVPGLVCYGLAVCTEWEARGHLDATRQALLEFTAGLAPAQQQLAEQGRLPPWLGHEPVHRSHQSALVRKEPERYRDLFPDVPEDLPYAWPAPAFPRWPVRRGSPEPLALPAALALLGYEQPREPQREACDAVRAGRDYTLALPPGGGSTTAGLLAGLCTPGSTLWVTPGPVPATTLAPPPATPQAVAPARTVSGGRSGKGKLSASIARPPSPEAAAAVAAEAACAGAEPDFRFLRPVQLGVAAARGAGLVVLDDRAPGYRDEPTAVPDLGPPVLRLTRAASGS